MIMDTNSGGPAEYPCSACKLEVEDGDQAIQYEGNCASWFYCACGLGCKLTDAQYEKVTTLEEKWICANCCGDKSLPAFITVNAVDVFHFNLQQNMPGPKLTVGKQFICSFYGHTFLGYFVL